MKPLSVKDASIKYKMSEREAPALCESGLFRGAGSVGGARTIPSDAPDPRGGADACACTDASAGLSLQEACAEIGVSVATGRNWLKLGKMVSTGTRAGTPVFSTEYVEALKSEIRSGGTGVLKSRRNKKFVSGFGMYRSYVSADCAGSDAVARTMKAIEKEGVEPDDALISVLVADAAVQMLSRRFDGRTIRLTDFLASRDRGFYAGLVTDLLPDADAAWGIVGEHPGLFSSEYPYEKGEDVLGLLYISCVGLGDRKATGTYYTPTDIVRKLVSELRLGEGTGDETVLDPCCGTGNFLLQLPDRIGFENVYGNDIDPMSVRIARINAVLRYGTRDLDTVRGHFTVSDYLLDYGGRTFDYIVGNPPWGYEFDRSQIAALDERYETACGGKTESYDVFVEKALSDAASGGTVSFVLPEAVLNVGMHRAVRRYISEHASVRYLEYLGNAFDGIQCPCVIMRTEKTERGMSSVGTKVVTGGESYVIETERVTDPECFSFLMRDDEYEIIHGMEENGDMRRLLGNAVFALGIVTGKNAECVSTERMPGSEVVLKGSDVFRFRYRVPERYIRFRPDEFQQVAPERCYRADEKLLYRFICGSLVFAYDDMGTLSLNSCNLVIPRIEGLSCKYVVAVLNSRVAQFYFKKSFNSVKVLRSYIEKIPIPYAGEDGQRSVETLVDEIRSADGERTRRLYEEIDEAVTSLYGLNRREREVVLRATRDDNPFLT